MAWLSPRLYILLSGAVPVAQKPRPVSYYLQEPLRKWLDECIKEDIYEEVQPGEPFTWCSPLVVQSKPRYANVEKYNLEPHMIRGSVDLEFKTSILTEQNHASTSRRRFHACKYFSKMDLHQGYHQLILHPDSRSIETFSTPWGNMRPKRLIFGTKASQDLFDEAMFRIFGDIPFCLNQRDDSITSEDTMAFFDPRLPIIVRTEASFHEGFSTGLFQKTRKGLQPVHYISRSMTVAEKRYSQTEKDALAVKSRFSMYLLGAPKFHIMTSHKPLIPMFNRSCTKLPPRIEKWIMEMQDVIYELIYEPGKDAADPMDYLCRHPLEDKEDDDTERVIKMIVFNEHGVVTDSIKDTTSTDETLKLIKEIMKDNKWEHHKHRPETKQFYQVRHELYRVNGLILRNRQVVLPKRLQRDAIRAAHSMGHFGMT